MSSSVVTRKRSRARLFDEDELSPEKGQTTIPLASIKKRKLNTYGSSPGDGTVLSSLKRTVGGIFGWHGKEKENLKQDDEEDELASGLSIDTKDEEREAPEKDIWDVEVSEPEEDQVRKRNGAQRSRPIATPNKTRAASSKDSVRATHISNTDELAEDIWEIPEEDPSASRSIRKLATSTVKARALLAPVVSDDDKETPTKRLPGRPRKYQILKEAKKLSNKAVRQRMMTGGSEEDEVVVTPRKRKATSKEENGPAHIAPQPAASSERKRGRPRKASIDVTDSVRRVPKGILTPSKNKAGRPRKSVAFGEAGEVDLGFKDLPAGGSKKSSAEPHVIPAHASDREPEEDVYSEEADDIACAVCSGLDSKKKNPIIICENCEYSVHQKCYKLSAIPEGDWLCKDCQPTPESETKDPPEEEIDSDASEDIACAVCSGLDSKKKNPIIICEGCEYTVHKKCYEVSVIPKGDWFCKECESKAGDDFLFPQLDPLALAESSNNLPNIEGFEGHLRHMQRALLDKLTSQRRVRLRGYDEERQKVHQVVEHTVLAGEGNSMLVIGARGSGKTTLVESVISDLSDQRENFHVVRLNGFIHTDDKLALKEIWRQLGREMELEDDIAGKTSNYADTLASLLAILSHPSEIPEAQTDQTAKSVIFILDEFDLFTTHSRQTLLYNLFDIAQARKAPIVVLGLTTRIDVVESLEKRVKSRFSHRYVHLSLPRSLPAFWDICKEGLTVDAEELENEGFDVSITGQREFLSYWQAMIHDLYNKDESFKHHLESEFYRTKSVPAFFTSCILPIANLSTRNFPLTSRTFTSNSLCLSAPDSKLELLQGLSELELALLIAAARLDIILDTDTCNFAMAYDEYSSLTSRHKIQTSSTGVTALGASAKVWGRDVALSAWERLAEYELLVPAGIGSGGGREFGAGGRMWKVDVGLEEITGSVEVMSGVMIKWCREI